MSKRARWPYLVVAAVLLGLGAYLSSAGDPAKSEAPPVKMPRHADADDVKRAAERVGPKPEQPKVVLGAPPSTAEPRRPSDPVLAALPPEVKELAVVIEANALRNSDLGEAMIACFTAGAPNALGAMRDAGFDPLTQLDRVSLFDDTLMITGDFSGVNLGAGSSEHYGDAVLSRVQRPEGENVMAVWRNQVTLIGSDEEVKRAVDRLEGRGAPGEQPVLGQADAYGEMYGVLKPDTMAKMFDSIDPKLSDFIRGAASQVQLHVDAMHDVGVVADVKGVDPRQVDELRRMMAGAVAAARARAIAEGHPEAADVLDLSRVLAAKGDGRSFAMELGLPYALLKTQLDKCAVDAEARREARAKSLGDGPPPSP